jgi:hypothetical protein
MALGVVLAKYGLRLAHSANARGAPNISRCEIVAFTSASSWYRSTRT